MFCYLFLDSITSRKHSRFSSDKMIKKNIHYFIIC
nr:MAG TPA: hypothetical protein [Caudoviricetes sp.]